MPVHEGMQAAQDGCLKPRCAPQAPQSQYTLTHVARMLNRPERSSLTQLSIQGGRRDIRIEISRPSGPVQ